MKSPRYTPKPVQKKPVCLTRQQLIWTLMENKTIQIHGLTSEDDYEPYSNYELLVMYHLAEDDHCDVQVIDEIEEILNDRFDDLLDQERFEI